VSPELDGKRPDLLIEAMPGARRIAAIADSKVTPAHHLQGLASPAFDESLGCPDLIPERHGAFGVDYLPPTDDFP
jgi:hypothetical protein